MAITAFLLPLAAALAQAAPAAPRDPLELLEALTAEPRILGTAGYERALDVLEAEFRASGFEVERLETTVGCNPQIPIRSDVELFDDDIAEEAYAGLRERWDPDARPTMPHPAAYPWNPMQADVRAPLVDCGGGRAEDFERLGRYGLSAEGAIALVSASLVPCERSETVRDLAARARGAGCVALLIAPAEPGPVRDDFVLAVEHPWAPTRASSAHERFSLPIAPIRSVEAASIRERLKAKRVRGADGSGTTIRVGPGPVEARVRVENPVGWRADWGAPMLICSWPAESDPTRANPLPTGLGIPYGLQLVVEEQSNAVLGGAVSLAAVVLATRNLTAATHPTGRIQLSFGVADGVQPRPNALLAPTRSAVLPGRLAPLYGETPARLSKRLDGELLSRLHAASLWIREALGTADPLGRLDTVPKALLAPLPSER